MSEQTTLGEILPISYGKARTETYGVVRQETPVYGSSGEIGSFNRALTKGPALIVGRKGSAGAVFYAPGPCWPIDTVYFTEGNERAYLPYFRYLLESLALGRFDRSTAVPSLSRDDYNSISINVPTVDEQRRIVAEIEEQLSRLEAGVAALKRVQVNLKRYRASVLAAACSGRLVPTEAALARAEGRSYETGVQLLARIIEERRAHWTGKGNYKEPAASGTPSLPDLPEAWAWANIEQVGEIIGGLTKNPKRESLPLKLPYLRVANVYADELRLDDIEHIGVNEAELEKLRLSVDDLLIVEGNGSLAQIGRVAHWDGSIDPCVHQNHLIKVRLAGVNARWVMQWLLSMPGRAHIEAVAASTSGLHTLSTGKVARLPVPLPPLPEQHRIVAEVDRRLSLVREAEQQVEADLTRGERLRLSALQFAFQTGASNARV